MPKKIRLLIVDDHAIKCEGLKQLFAQDCDLKVVAEAGNGSLMLQHLQDEHARTQRRRSTDTHPCPASIAENASAQHA